MFAGGGIRSGTLVGASDKTGADPLFDPQLPDNVWQPSITPGFSPETIIRDQSGRPIANAASIGKLFA